MKTILSLLFAVTFSPLVPAATNLPVAAVTLEGFKLVGEMSGDQAVFTLTAAARVENRKGGTLELLSGAAALTEINSHSQWRVQVESNRYVVVFDHAGTFPLKLKLNAAVRQHDN